ncbi:hypothetical protein ACLI4Z_03395 [Natrialbaceae archaeon A-arb3/5]
MDKETLPRWGWLLVGLIITSVAANILNALLLGPAGLAEEYHVVTVITAMSLVLIYIGVWYDEDRQHYWEHSTERIVGDVSFVLIGAAAGSSLALVVIGDFDLSQIVLDVIAMVSGFLLSWVLFWWRNQDLYQQETPS